ncbi:MAG TPA: phytanoyl-CoA dioxygenase family protein [Membranihabitans sp.]|nr:phytanoyl-CoA dioxygenase family protein [Membranihabitans sp.]
MNNISKFNYQVLSDEQIRFYQEYGYLKVGFTLTSRGMEEMLAECMEAWKAEKLDFDPDKTWLQNALLVDIHKRSNLVKEFYFDGPIVDMMVQLIGPNIKAATSQLTFKMRGNTKSFDWHQDNGYGELDPYNTISALTALEDVDEENGCLRIIPGSHKEGQVVVNPMSEKKKRQQDVSISLEVDESKAISVPMKAGETLIFHCWTLHQSRGNFSETRDRRILFMRYADADAVEVYNDRKPRLGRLVRGTSIFPEVESFEAGLYSQERK